VEPTRIFGAEQETTLPPEAVLVAVRDFSPRRAKIWPNVSEGHFEVHDSGDGWTEVTEEFHPLGFLGFWERSRYDWTVPGEVTATVVEAKGFVPGSTWRLTAQPSDNGSRVRTEFRRGYQPTLLGRVVHAFNLLGGPFARSDLKKALKAIEADHAGRAERDR
jgi:hypothetical protein